MSIEAFSTSPVPAEPCAAGPTVAELPLKFQGALLHKALDYLFAHRNASLEQAVTAVVGPMNFDAPGVKQAAVSYLRKALLPYFTSPVK